MWMALLGSKLGANYGRKQSLNSVRPVTGFKLDYCLIRQAAVQPFKA